MDNKIYNKVVTELQDPDTLKIELEGYGLYTNKAVSFIKGSNVYYAVLQNGSKGIENSIISPMKEVIGIMELIKEEHEEIDDVTICDIIIDIPDDVYTWVFVIYLKFLIHRLLNVYPIQLLLQ